MLTWEAVPVAHSSTASGTSQPDTEYESSSMSSVVSPDHLKCQSCDPDRSLESGDSRSGAQPVSRHFRGTPRWHRPAKSSSMRHEGARMSAMGHPHGTNEIAELVCFGSTSQARVPGRF